MTQYYSFFSQKAAAIPKFISWSLRKIQRDVRHYRTSMSRNFTLLRRGMGLEKKRILRNKEDLSRRTSQIFFTCLECLQFSSCRRRPALFSEATPLCHILFKHLKGLSLFIMSNRTTTTNFLELNVKSDWFFLRRVHGTSAALVCSLAKKVPCLCLVFFMQAP